MTQVVLKGSYQELSKIKNHSYQMNIDQFQCQV